MCMVSIGVEMLPPYCRLCRPLSLLSAAAVGRSVDRSALPTARKKSRASAGFPKRRVPHSLTVNHTCLSCNERELFEKQSNTKCWHESQSLRFLKRSRLVTRSASEEPLSKSENLTFNALQVSRSANLHVLE